MPLDISAFGRPLCTSDKARTRGFASHLAVQRQQVLLETLTAFAQDHPANTYQQKAHNNLMHWQVAAKNLESEPRVQVHAGDWGEVTQKLSAKYGECFAVLNMANAFVPGGAYVEGASAQEENMYRRTNCHFSITAEDYDVSQDRYKPHMTLLLSGRVGQVYLDTQNPRVCIRGAEDATRKNLGYAWLEDTEIFPFYELRAAAQDLRGGVPFDPQVAKLQIAAQFQTLKDQGVRHVVLGAFGCGAFCNPPKAVAAIYQQEIKKQLPYFDCIAFAIRNTNPHRDNFTPFVEAMEEVQ